MADTRMSPKQRERNIRAALRKINEPKFSKKNPTVDELVQLITVVWACLRMMELARASAKSWREGIEEGDTALLSYIAEHFEAVRR